MAKATTTISFADGDQITSTKLNEIISGFSLGADSADASTITIAGGVLSVGTIAAGNIGANAVTTVKINDLAVTSGKIAADAVTTAKILDANVTAAKVAADAIAWTKTLTADRAVQADMQAESPAHFVAPDVLKYHPGVAKAYGVVAFESASAAVTGGYNVASATDTGSGRQITFTNAMANANYTVLCTYLDSTGDPGIRITARTTTTFTIDPVAGESSGRKIAFSVFGQLA